MFSGIFKLSVNPSTQIKYIVFNRYVYIRTPIFTTDVLTFCYVLSWVKSLFLIKMNHDVSGENTLYHTFL